MIKTSFETNNQKNMNDTEEKIRDLEQIIMDQKNIIDKQNERIQKYIFKNEKQKYDEYIKNKNRFILKEINKILDICINFVKKDTHNYYIYGSFFENLFSNLELENTNIKVLLENYHIKNIESLCEIFYTLGFIKNKSDYNLLKVRVQGESEILYYNIVLKLPNNEKNINLIIHDTTYYTYIDRTTRNFTLTYSGISLISNLKNNNFFSSDSTLDLLNNLYNITNKRIGFYYSDNMKDIKNNPFLLNLIEEQKEYKQKGIKVINKIKTKKNDCPVCFESDDCVLLDCNHSFCNTCLSNHIESNNYENKTCPLCRSKILLK